MLITHRLYRMSEDIICALKLKYLTVIEPENETSWNRGFSDFNENRHKDGNLGLHDYEGQQKVIFFNFGKISISG